jgi:transcriptional regulator with XRE-family HTH domain
MTQPDRMELLRTKCEELSQAEVARRISRSPSAITQILKGSYQGDPTIILTLVEEVFGKSTVQCPILGEITLGRCAENRKREFAATNPTRVRLFRTCPTCGGKP